MVLPHAVYQTGLIRYRSVSNAKVLLPAYDPPLMVVSRATRRGAMLSLQGEHAKAGDGILASRKNLTSLCGPHTSFFG